MKKPIVAAATTILLAGSFACSSDDFATDESSSARRSRNDGGGTYDFPIHNRFLATVGAAFGSSFGIRSKSGFKHSFRKNEHYKTIPSPGFLDEPRDRSFVRGFKIPVEVLIQDDKRAPLVYVLPGAGSDYRAGSSQVVAQYFYGLGYHVITTTSSINHHFLLGASNNVVIGDLKDDLRDFYDLAVSLLNRAKAEHGIRPANSGLVGMSLGAYFGAMVMKMDESRKLLNLSRAYLINPPVDVEYSMEQVDQFYLNSHFELNFSERLKQSFTVIRNLISQNLKSQRVNPMSFASTLEKIGEKASEQGQMDEKFQHIISIAFRKTLSDVLCTAWESSMFSSMSEKNCSGPARVYGVEFRDYLDDYVFPYLRNKGASVSKTRKLYHMRHLEKFLRRSDEISVATNADDPIINASHVKFLKRTFGNRARIFSHGGHLGNIWWPENLCNMEKAFKGMTPYSGRSHKCGKFDF